MAPGPFIFFDPVRVCRLMIKNTYITSAIYTNHLGACTRDHHTAY